MKLSLVVPCFNEEKNVPLFYKEAHETFSRAGIEYELVFVDDGSSDNTFAIIKRLCTGPVPVRAISFSRNFGKEAAMMAGLAEATGDYVAVIDADLQQRPSIVVDMVRMLDSDKSVDCVAAYQNTRDESGVLNFFKNSFYDIINLFSETKFHQGASDFRCFRRQMVEAVLSMKECYRFSKGLFSWVGFNTSYIPYKAEQRAQGESKWSFKKLFLYAVDGIEAFTVAPLRLPLLLSAAFLVISLILFIVFMIVNKAFVDIAVIFFVGGVILGCVGIIGEYLAKTYVQGKNRPVYIVKEKISNKK